MTWMLVLLLLVSSVALMVVVVLRRRDVRSVGKLINQIKTINHSAVSAPIVVSGIVTPLADHLQPMVERLAALQHLLRDHDRQLLSILQSSREPLAVHGEQIVFANDSFAALLGKQRGTELQGRLLVDLVPRDYATLLNNHLYRALHDEPVPERLELELHPRPEQIARVELKQQTIGI